VPDPLLPPVPAHPAFGRALRPGLGGALRALAREQPIVLTVRGDCMAPRLRDGDRVAVGPARRYWPGDVVAFETAQGVIALHRLLGLRRSAGRLAWVTRGDRCELADTPLPPERLLGRVLAPPPVGERLRAVAALAGLALAAVRRRLAG
jgi:Peptidase S24-like